MRLEGAKYFWRTKALFLEAKRVRFGLKRKILSAMTSQSPV